jgi:hypothetical protein
MAGSCRDFCEFNCLGCGPPLAVGKHVDNSRSLLQFFYHREFGFDMEVNQAVGVFFLLARCIGGIRFNGLGDYVRIWLDCSHEGIKRKQHDFSHYHVPSPGIVNSDVYKMADNQIN